VTTQLSTAELWPPNGKTRTVTVTGTAADSGSGLVQEGNYRVADEYGQVQPAGTFRLTADGTFSFDVSLEARRLGTDLSGRTYTIVVTVRDVAGNESVTSTTVVVPHDQGK
jgi:hypothetical protein